LRTIVLISILILPFSLFADVLDDFFRRMSGSTEKEALILARRGEYKKAREILEPLYLDNPDDPGIVSEYIWLTIRMGHAKEALALYAGFENKGLLSKDIRKELEKLKADLDHAGAVELARAGRHDEALKIIDECLMLNPDSIPLKADKVLVLVWKGEAGKALLEYEKFFSGGDAPEFLKAEISVLREKSKELVKPAQAEDAEKKVSAEEKAKPDAEKLCASAHERAVELARGSKYEESLLMLHALMNDPGAPRDDIVNDRIVVLSWSGRHDEAVELYEEERGKFREKPYLHRDLANSYMRLGRPGEAIKHYMKAIEASPGDNAATEGAALAIFAKDGPEAAFEFLDGCAAKPGADNGSVENIRMQIRQRMDMDAKIAKAEQLVKSRDLKALRPLAEELARENPKNPRALIIMVYCHQIAEEYFKALDLDESILRMSPGYMPAINTRYHILLDIKAAQAAKEKLDETGDNVGLDIRNRILGDLSAEQIKFLAPKKAIRLLDENIQSAEDHLRRKDSVEAAEVFKRRAQFDKFLAMRQAEMMRQIVSDYEKIKEEKIELPYWVLEAAADAYLYLKEPEKAIELYEQVLLHYQEQGRDRYPYSYELLMAKYAALIELERHREAREIIERLENDIPYFARTGGVLVENWNKVSVSTEKAWCMIFDDRLGEAEEYLEGLVASAPHNSNPRIAQAYLHLYRDFPRLSLEDFQMATNLDPESKEAAIGHAYALDLNDRSGEGRNIAAKLLEKHPDDLGVQKLGRHFEIQDMRLLSIKSNFSQGGSFVDGAGYTVRLDQPIYPWRKVYAETIWMQTKDEFERRNIFRSGIGFDWRLNRDLTLDGAFTLDHQGRDPGIKGGIRWSVDDHLTLGASYDSYSLDLPPKALLHKYKGQEAKFTAAYRFSEDLLTEASFSNIRLSDGNSNQNYTMRIDKGLTYSAHWKTRLALEGFLTTNRKPEDRGYYAPKYAGSVYAVPMVEHMWYRRYDFSVFDRLYFGIGPHWEKSFKTEEVWYLRYEQEWRLTDTFYFKVGGQYGKSKYGRDNPHGWNFYTEIYWNF